MPFIGIGFSTLIAIGFAIHAIQSRQDRYWLYILFIFPFLGSVVYFVVIFLPDFRGGHSGYYIESKLRKALDPNRELREATNAIEVSNTVDNQVRLAKALVDNDNPQEAINYYQKALNGIYKNAPDILLQYAYALFVDKQYLKAKETLEHLREVNPNYRSDEGHLLYAKILVCLNEKRLALDEFNALIDYYPSFEALSHYLQALYYWKEFTSIEQQLQNFDLRLKHLPKHAKRLNAPWIKEIQQLRDKLPTATIIS